MNITQPRLCTNNLFLETCCPLHEEILESSLYHQAGLVQSSLQNSYGAQTTTSHSIQEACREVEDIAQAARPDIS